MYKRLIALLLLAFTLVNCNAQKPLKNLYNSINCEYTYNSISDIAVSNIKMSSNPSPLQLTRIAAAVISDAASIPFDFTINIDVKNSSKSPATLFSMQYIVILDNVEFSRGKIGKAIKIGVGETANMPISVGTDIATLSRTNSHEIIVEIVQNFLGLGSQKSNVLVKLKPTFLIGNVPVTSPAYIPVSFSFGGGK